MTTTHSPPLPPHTQLANYYERLIAGIFDITLVILFIVGTCAPVFFLLSFNQPEHFWQQTEQIVLFFDHFPWLVTLVILAIFTLENGYLLYTQGQTIGKKIMGIQIVRCNEAPASLLYSLIYRYYCGIGFGLFFLSNEIPELGIVYLAVDILCIFFSSGQCIHDAVADTMVVRIPSRTRKKTSLFKIETE